MLFNSFEFLVFFPLVTAILFALPQRFRKGWLLACSVYFYMSWSPVFILLILYSTTTDYFVAKRFEAARSAATRKGWLVLSLVTNFGALFFFKYYNFFIESWAAVRAAVGLHTNVPLLSVILPVGISFYTFEAISYTIDVYRGRYPAEKSYLRLLLFITFFPKLIAGPIERAGHLIPQFERETRLDRERLASGLRLMAWGFFKKLVIADRIAVYVNTVYAAPAEHHGATVLIGAYFFAFQIFCDFSAYTDIATGAARILGYDLLENFRRPYQARSIQDFWSRWHISLSSWFRDYLYIPLGGNRVSRARWCANLLIVFLISGLWHGANWTFVVWGGLHGLYLVLSILSQPMRDGMWRAVARLSRPRAVAPLASVAAGGGVLLHPGASFVVRDSVNEAASAPPRGGGAAETGRWESGVARVRGLLATVITFHLVVVAWIFFRAGSVTDAVLLIQNLGDWSAGFKDATLDLKRYWFAVAVLAIGVMEGVHLIQRRGSMAEFLARLAPWQRWTIYYALVMAILLFGAYSRPAEFIYFQF